MCFACVDDRDSRVMNMGYDNEKDISVLDNSLKTTMGVSHALKAALLAAKKEGRIASGLIQAVEMLDMNLDGVMYAILPDNIDDDITLHIHCKLIEALCLENDIPLLKVDSTEKLGKILAGSSVVTSEVNANDERTSIVDYNCILVEFPANDEVSEDEEAVIDFYKLTCDTEPQPVVNLDV